MKQQQCEREAITLLPDDAIRVDHQIAAVVDQLTGRNWGEQQINI